MESRTQKELVTQVIPPTYHPGPGHHQEEDCGCHQDGDPCPFHLQAQLHRGRWRHHCSLKLSVQAGQALGEVGVGVRRLPRYVVIGAGKTGMDAALHLLDSGVDSDNITWIISQDCWYSNR